MINFTFLTFKKFLQQFSFLFVAILLKTAELLSFWQFEFDTIQDLMIGQMSEEWFNK